MLNKGISTDVQGYKLNAYIEETGDSPVEGMEYEDSPLMHCSVLMLSVTQPLSAPLRNDEVKLDPALQRLKLGMGYVQHVTRLPTSFFFWKMSTMPVLLMQV